MSKNINNNFSVAIEGSLNTISKWGSKQTDDLMYLNLSSYLKYDLSSLLKLQNTAFEPFFGLGGGYTWIEIGPFNTSNNPEKEYNGNFSVNGTVGFFGMEREFWVSGPEPYLRRGDMHIAISFLLC